MSILYLLIPLTLLMLGVAVAVFFWAVKSGQFDDLEGPAHRILYDDDEEQLMPADQRRRTAHPPADRDSTPPPSDHEHPTEKANDAGDGSPTEPRIKPH